LVGVNVGVEVLVRFMVRVAVWLLVGLFVVWVVAVCVQEAVFVRAEVKEAVEVAEVDQVGVSVKVTV